MTKSKIIACRLSNSEYNDVSVVANQLNIKKSDIIRLCISDSLKKYRPINLSNHQIILLEKNRRLALDTLGKLSTLASDLNNQWSHIGNNLNQLAYDANSRQLQDDPIIDSFIYEILEKLSKNKLIHQNDLLNRRLTQVWQLLNSRIQ